MCDAFLLPATPCGSQVTASCTSVLYLKGTLVPTAVPTTIPTDSPTAVPTVAPTAVPTTPTAQPTSAPTAVPTAQPATAPTTAQPTTAPATAQPTAQPTTAPATAQPTTQPATAQLTAQPTTAPATAQPTAQPTAVPTAVPTPLPPGSSATTAAPTTAPTATTTSPTNTTTAIPATVSGTTSPTTNKTLSPTSVPTTATVAPATSAPSVVNNVTVSIVFNKYSAFSVIQITADTNNTNGTIYYTLDGSDPNPSNPGSTNKVYTGNVTVRADVVVKAVFVNTGNGVSNITEVAVTVNMLTGQLEITPTSTNVLAGAFVTMTVINPQLGYTLIYLLENADTGIGCSSQSSFLQSNLTKRYTTPFSLPQEAGRWSVCGFLVSKLGDVKFEKQIFTTILQCGSPVMPESKTAVIPVFIMITPHNESCPFATIDVTITQVGVAGSTNTYSYNQSQGVALQAVGNYSVSSIASKASDPTWRSSLATQRYFVVVEQPPVLIARVNQHVVSSGVQLFQNKIAQAARIDGSRVRITDIQKDTTTDGDNMLFFFQIDPHPSYYASEQSSSLISSMLTALPQSVLVDYDINAIWRQGELPVTPAPSSDDSIIGLSRPTFIVVVVVIVIVLCVAFFLFRECCSSGSSQKYLSGVTREDVDKWESEEMLPNGDFEEYSDKGVDASRATGDNIRPSHNIYHQPEMTEKEAVELVYSSGPLLPYPPITGSGVVDTAVHRSEHSDTFLASKSNAIASPVTMSSDSAVSSPYGRFQLFGPPPPGHDSVRRTYSQPNHLHMSQQPVSWNGYQSKQFHSSIGNDIYSKI